MTYAIWLSAIAIATLVLVAVAAGLRKTRRGSKALHALMRGIQAVGKGDLSYRMASEFGALAENFNEMVSQLEKRSVSKESLEASESKLQDLNAYLSREMVERKRALEHFRLVVEAAPNGLLMTNEQGIIVLANSQIETLFLYSKKELLGQSIETLLPERFRSKHSVDRASFFTDPKTRPMGGGREFLGLRKDGSEFPLEIGLIPLKMPAGTLVLASIMDITERKAVNERVKQSEERFRSMIESVKNHAIYMLDLQGRVLTWNKGAERLRVYQSEEIIGKHYRCFYPVEERESGRPEQILKTALAEGLCEVEGWHLRKDGSKFWANIVITAVRNGGAKLLGFSVVTRDLTRRRKIEEQLKLAKEEADAANRAKSLFLANISHEIRTPMTGIIGMAGLLFDTNLSPEQAEYCAIMRRSSESLLTVINELLDFSKIESGKLELETIDFDLRSSVEEVMDLFAKQAEDKGVELINFIRCDVPTELQGDPSRLRQILSNLVNNALKFTAQGEVVLQVTVQEETSTHATLRFSVTDTGIGILKEKIQKLFASFTQVDASMTRKYGGTGLGLAISKKFVELMRGEIGVDSEPGRGSSFWFTVQLRKQQEARQPAKARTNLQSLRVLVVEGNATNRTVLDHYLNALGITSRTAADGPSALELLHVAAAKSEPFDLAILDFMLPGMDGLTLAQAIRQELKIGCPKLLLLNSVGKREDESPARCAGIDAYLTKPVRFSQLCECIAVLMGDASMVDPSSALVTTHTLAELKGQRRLRVLVADDNHINQKVTASLLEKMGHRADVVGNGKEALEAFKLVPYDAVLMDIQMPEMDGFEASLKIRAVEEKKGSHTPIIAITAHAMNGYSEKCFAAGMDDYISKPINPQALRAVMERTTGAARPVFALDPAPQPPYGVDVFNVDEALAQLESDMDLLGQIVQLFVAQYPKLLEETRQALSRSDCLSLAAAAHTLASSVGQLGAQRACAAARKLEQMGRQGNLSDVPRALAELEGELQLLKSAVSNSIYLSERTPDSLATR
jgi:two-component system sensor histidine kinase/response regulator